MYRQCLLSSAGDEPGIFAALSTGWVATAVKCLVGSLLLSLEGVAQVKSQTVTDTQSSQLKRRADIETYRASSNNNCVNIHICIQRYVHVYSANIYTLAL